MSSIPARTRGALEARAERSAAARVRLPAERWVHHLVLASLVLVAATILALVAANSPLRDAYRAVWATPVDLRLGPVILTEDLRALVVDGLMTIFFLVVTLEVKRELVVGDLASPRAAAFPIAAAVGGMVVPAAVFLAVNLPSSAGAPGAWGMAVATDVAFSVGALALFRPARTDLRTLLLSMSVADDIGGILIIAAVYATHLQFGALMAAIALIALLWQLQRMELLGPAPAIALGIGLWLLLHASGVHATLAGVALGAIVPARARRDPREAINQIDGATSVAQQATKESEVLRALGRISELSESTESKVDAVSRHLQPWSRYLVLPLFAFAEAGVFLHGGAVGSLLLHPVAVGVALALVAGKPVGILAGMWLAERAGIGTRPDGLGWRDLTGIAFLGGIGFTVSLFIAGLAVGDDTHAAAVAGIILASVVSALLAAAWLRTMVPPTAAEGGP